MKKHFLFSILSFLILILSCKNVDKPKKEQAIKASQKESTTPFIWDGANVYFLLTDRFKNGDTSNDISFDRTKDTAVLRGFKGGDLQGITQKINEGYFDKLGINAIWFTPVVEQIHGLVDEGTGATYGYHGYWAKDWTALDPNFGTHKDLKQLVDTAHNHGIRIIMDVVLNHTGPVTNEDPFWGNEWAIQDPNCTYTNYDTTVNCTLVENLPDIQTASSQEVAIPEHLAKKWRKENRYDKEIQELDAYFTKNDLKRTPRNYIIKWLTDYIRDYGIDAYRVDTAKHVEEDAWLVLREQANKAFDEWKNNNPNKVLDDTNFFMLGEVYNYMISSGREYDFGDVKVDFFEHGFDNLINFQFKYDAKEDLEKMFANYDSILHSELKDKSVLNYATSHDDGDPFDKKREYPIETATKLLLTPGISQVYYGDELARPLEINGASGDAHLRSAIDWEAVDNPKTQKILTHWQKLGQFRKKHPAVGAGRHAQISQKPYIFSRILNKKSIADTVVIGLNLPQGEKTIPLGTAFKNGTKIKDHYSGKEGIVKKGSITLTTSHNLVLLEKSKS